MKDEEARNKEPGAWGEFEDEDEQEQEGRELPTSNIERSTAGAISVDEFTTKPTKPVGHDETAKFTALDTDFSGGLSLAEFTAGAPKGATSAQIQAAFTKVDANGNGSITLAEFVAGPPADKHGHGGPPKGGKGGCGTTGSNSSSTAASL